jgi:hypothetical protein
VVAVGFSESIRGSRQENELPEQPSGGFVILVTCKLFKSSNKFADIPKAKIKGMGFQTFRLFCNFFFFLFRKI